jgi:hypothetical protein
MHKGVRQATQGARRMETMCASFPAAAGTPQDGDVEVGSPGAAARETVACECAGKHRREDRRGTSAVERFRLDLEDRP